MLGRQRLGMMTPMRRIHLAVGLLAVVAFLISGQVMHRQSPPVDSLGDSARLMLRSRHIYLLAGGLVNLMLGLYFIPKSGWRGHLQRIAGLLLVVSPVLLGAAFVIEPARGFQPAGMWWSSPGLYALFGGAMAHLAAGGKG